MKAAVQPDFRDAGSLDESSPTPLYLQLQHLIQQAVRSGKLRADEALLMGMVDEVVVPDEVYSAARRWAAQFVDGPARALAGAKAAIDDDKSTVWSTDADAGAHNSSIIAG